MEAAGVKQMFERSRSWKEGGAIYREVLRDRDADVMFHIWFTYQDLGLCEKCEELKDTDAKSKLWKDFMLVFILKQQKFCLIQQFFIHFMSS